PTGEVVWCPRCSLRRVSDDVVLRRHSGAMRKHRTRNLEIPRCAIAHLRSGASAPSRNDRGYSMPAMGLLHRGQLLGTGVALISRLPGLVGHAVDGFAALVLADLDALGIGFFLEPVGQAVAAE